MLNRWSFPLRPLVMILVLSAPGLLSAQPDKEGDLADVPQQGPGSFYGPRSLNGPLPTAAVDPAFDRYVDATQLGQAWDKLDAAGLTDAGLQLAEGERILLRAHKAFPAETVLQLAARAAAARRDVATLDRLSKAAQAQGRAELIKQVAIARKTADAARENVSSLDVSIQDITPMEFRELHETYLAMERAEVTGNRKYLDQLSNPSRDASSQKARSDRDGASKALKLHQQLTALSKSAREGLPEASPFDPHVTDLLDQLGEATRDDETPEPAGTPANVTRGH